MCFVVYSCGQSWLDTYKLSYLRLKDPDADLLDPKSWIKSDKPVFEGTDQVFGDRGMPVFHNFS